MGILSNNSRVHIFFISVSSATQFRKELKNLDVIMTAKFYFFIDIRTLVLKFVQRKYLFIMAAFHMCFINYILGISEILEFVRIKVLNKDCEVIRIHNVNINVNININNYINIIITNKKCYCY